MDMTRRSFVGSSAVIAAGAAFGIPMAKGIKCHAPAKIWTYFLSNEPILMEAMFSASEECDTFNIHALVGSRNEVVAEMPLAAMKEAIEEGKSRSKVILLVIEDGRRSKVKMPVAMTIEDKNVKFIFDEPGFPIWTTVADIQRVL